MKRRIIVAALLLVVPLLTAAKCGKPYCPGTQMGAPPSECDFRPPSFAPAPSFTPAGLLIGDGLYEVGKDIPAGAWESVEVPSELPGCVWFVSPDPSRDPDSQNLPSYTQFRKARHPIRLVLERGMSLTTSKCGRWELTDVR